MKFGALPLSEAAGAILAHSHGLKKGGRIRKGAVLTAEDIAKLRASGYETVIVARLEADDVPENEAAQRLAEALAGPGLRAGPPGTGRCNLHTDRAGLAIIDADRVHAFNAVDEAITLATLPPFASVAPGEIVATVKIIPFAARADSVARCKALAEETAPPLRLAPYRTLRCALIQTTLISLKAAVARKTAAATRARIEAIGGVPVREMKCPHEETAIAGALREAADSRCDLALLIGASAIVDRRDAIPAAVQAAGGSIDHFGMPVDPGNLTLLARIGRMHVLGLPGSARSDRLHGSDWIMQRIAAGLRVTGDDIMRMGVGGLLKDVPGRPLPRERAAGAPAPLARIAAVVLAAGRSSRMGGSNKLLEEIGGVPLIRRTVERALAALPQETIVVTGHGRGAVEQALAGLPVHFVHNPEYMAGMSGSLKAGVAAVSAEAQGALICLGDMPDVSAALMARLVGAFAPASGRDIVVPARAGRRGNPVLIGRRHFDAIAHVSGDSGARGVIAANPSAVVEIESADPGIFLDVDTPDALAAYRERAEAR